MAKSIKDIESPLLISLFEEKKSYYIPDFQRNYVWKTNSDPNKEDRQVNLFLEDIKSAQDSHFSEYYLGPIITFENKNKSWEYQVIDGQQRLTTAILFTLAYKNFLLKIKGNNPQIFVLDNLIYRKLTVTEGRKQVVKDSEPFLNTSSKNGSKFLMDLYNGVDVLKKRYTNIPELINAYKSCQKFISDELESSPAKVKKFHNYMLGNCFFTWVQTDNFDEAFTIFERMNDRGLPLTMADKVKHYILQTLIDDKEKFSEDSQIINKLWGDIEDNLRVSRFTFDRFIRYHLVAHYWDETYYTAKEVLPWFRTKGAKKSTGLMTNQIKFLEKMKKDSEQLILFKDSKFEKDGEKEPSLHFPKAYFSKITQHLPILLAAASHSDQDFLLKVSNKLEGLIFVWSFADTKWNLLEKALPSICTAVRKKDLRSFNNKIDKLVSDHLSVAQLNLKDSEFLATHFMKSKYVLHRVDYYLSEKLKLTKSLNRDGITLEHIIPEKSSKGLSNSTPKNVSIDEYGKLRFRLGNMTLLSSSQNPIAGDKTPYQKIIKYDSSQPLYSGTLIPITKVLIDGKLENTEGSDKTKINKFANKHGLRNLQLYKDEYWYIDQIEEREKSFFSVLSELYNINL